MPLPLLYALRAVVVTLGIALGLAPYIGPVLMRWEATVAVVFAVPCGIVAGLVFRQWAFLGAGLGYVLGTGIIAASGVSGGGSEATLGLVVVDAMAAAVFAVAAFVAMRVSDVVMRFTRPN